MQIYSRWVGMSGGVGEAGDRGGQLLAGSVLLEIKIGRSSGGVKGVATMSAVW